MSDDLDIRNEIDYRIYHLLMRLDKGQEAAGVEVTGKVTAEQSEQHNARRELLGVEKMALKDKADVMRSELNTLQLSTKMVHDEVLSRIETEIEDLDTMNLRLLQLTPEISEILDLLAVRAVSLKRLEPVFGDVDWLANELLHLINNSPNRKRDRLGKVIRVESIRMALSFAGVENLKLIVPSLLFKNMLPKHMETYPFFKNKIWEHALASGISCMKIAEESGIDSFQGYVMGFLHEIGKLAITKMFFRHYEEVHQEMLVAAHEEKRWDDHQNLYKVKMSTDYWFTAMWRYSNPLTGRIMEHMEMRRIPIADAMTEYAAKLDFENLSPLARVLLQGDGYAKYRILKKYKLINIDEAKDYLRTFNFPKGSIAQLKMLDMEKLPTVDL